jgi:pyruvate kinase
LIAKLERRPAMAEVKEIAQAADALWICRGDLGAELGIAEMAVAVAEISSQVREYGRPVLMAGQVLEHMVEHLNPTRSEVCYLYETLQRGYAGVVLSDETAMGRYPLACCEVAAMFKKK